MSEDVELKRRLLELLERDVEFRRAVAGLTGLVGILERLDKIESEIKRTYEVLNRRYKALEENQIRA